MMGQSESVGSVLGMEQDQRGSPVLFEAVRADLSRFWIAFGMMFGAQLILVVEYLAVFPVVYVYLSIMGLTDSHSVQGNLERAWLAGFHLFFLAAAFWATIYIFGARKARGPAFIRAKASNSKGLRGWVYRLLVGGLTFGAFAVVIDWLFCRVDICVSNWARDGLFGTLGFYLVAVALWMLALVALARLLARLVKKVATRA